MSDLVERLIIDAACLRKMVDHAKLAGPETDVRVKSPGLLLDSLSEAADRISALEKENAELRADCKRKDELLTAAVDDYNDAREANRKLHRRCQVAESYYQSCTDYLTGWVDFYKSLGPERQRDRIRSLVLLRDMQDRIGAMHRRTALRDAGGGE